MHVTPEPAKLGDEYRALEPLCLSKGSLELRSALKRVMALAGLYLDIARGDGEAVSSGELHHCRLLSIEAQTRLALPSGRHPRVAHHLTRHRTLHAYNLTWNCLSADRSVTSSPM